jgi:hypothetical protein
MLLGAPPVAQFDRKLHGSILRQFVVRFDGERAVCPFDPLCRATRPKEVKGKPRQEVHVRMARVELESLNICGAGAGTIEYFLARAPEREPGLGVSRVGSEGAPQIVEDGGPRRRLDALHHACADNPDLGSGRVERHRALAGGDGQGDQGGPRSPGDGEPPLHRHLRGTR